MSAGRCTALSEAQLTNKPCALKRRCRNPHAAGGCGYWSPRPPNSPASKHHTPHACGCTYCGGGRGGSTGGSCFAEMIGGEGAPVAVPLSSVSGFAISSLVRLLSNRSHSTIKCWQLLPLQSAADAAGNACGLLLSSWSSPGDILIRSSSKSRALLSGSCPSFAFLPRMNVLAKSPPCFSIMPWPWEGADTQRSTCSCSAECSDSGLDQSALSPASLLLEAQLQLLSRDCVSLRRSDKKSACPLQKEQKQTQNPGS